MNELIEFSLDTENATKNYNLAEWYENQHQYAPAHTYYLRSAERSEDDLLAYKALIRSSFCYKAQGSRDGTEKIALENALNFLPQRPEAYYFLSLLYEKRQEWQNCYTYANLGLQCYNQEIHDLNVPEYPGKYSLIFQKAISAWWWGKGNESRQLFTELYENYWDGMDVNYKNLIKTNAEKIGLQLKDAKISDLFKSNTYNTDKYELGYITEIYDDIFFKIKDRPINLLEIGADYGESVRLWKDYLHPQSNIISGDIVSYFDDIEGTTQIIGDLYSDDLVNTFEDDYFDLIIDDGPHTLESFIKVIKKYYSKLKNDGILIIEDILDKDYLDCLINFAISVGYDTYEIFDVTNKQLSEDAKNRVAMVYDKKYNLKNGLYVLKFNKTKKIISNENPIPVLGVPIVNGIHWLKRLIDSIDYPVKELFIINNNGRDEITQELDFVKFNNNNYIEKISITHLPSNLGCSGAWNLIIKSYINAPYWIISNNDICFSPGLLEKMNDEAINTDSGMIHAKPSDWGGGSYDLFLIKDWVVQECGLFDENLYPIYAEDVDYHIRIKNQNIKCSFLNIEYLHGEKDYATSGSQTWRLDLSLKEKMNNGRIMNENEYLNKKWGENYHTLETYKNPFNNESYNSKYTTYDLNFVRKKYLGF